MTKNIRFTRKFTKIASISMMAVLMLLTGVLTAPRSAQAIIDGSIDTSFNTGTGSGAGTGPNSEVRATAIQSDGKIIIGGVFTSSSSMFHPNSVPRNRVARLNTNGSMDASFDAGAVTGSSVNAISIQSDGKIIVGGTFDSFNGTNRNQIARLNSDGSLDTSFDAGSGGNDGLSTFVMQSDGKIIVGGSFTSFSGTGRNRIARLHTNGSIDTSFDPGTGANQSITDMALQSDGKIIIGGSFSLFTGTSRNGIARLNTNGSLDTSFDPGTGVSIYGVFNQGMIRSIAIQRNGKIMISGPFQNYNYDGTFNSPITSRRAGIVRINTNGSMDTSFNPGGGMSPGTILTMSIQTDDKIIIGGSFDSYDVYFRNRVARIHATSPLTSTFTATAGPGGTITPSGAVSVDNGGNQAFTIIPTAPYLISQVLVDGFASGTYSNYSFANVTSDHTISVTFSRDVDGDGIENDIDTQPRVYSSDFSDGTATGTLAIPALTSWPFAVPAHDGRNGRVVTISKYPGQGVAVSANSGSGLVEIISCHTNVSPSVSDNTGPEKVILGSTGPTTARIDCRNLGTRTGYQTTRVASITGSPSTFHLQKAPLGYGNLTRTIHFSSGSVFYSGSPMESDPSNTENATWEINGLDGATLATGLLVPGDIIDIEFPTPTTYTVENLVTSPYSFTADREIITISTGQAFSDLCVGTPGNVAGTGCPFASVTSVTTIITGAKVTGECGLKNDGKPEDSCKIPTVGAMVKVFDQANADFMAAYGTKEPKKEDFGTVFEAGIGQVGLCTTGADGTCTVGLDHPGNFMVIVRLQDGSVTVYNAQFKKIEPIKPGEPADPKKTTITAEMKFTKEIDKNGIITYKPA